MPSLELHSQCLSNQLTLDSMGNSVSCVILVGISRGMSWIWGPSKTTSSNTAQGLWWDRMGHK